VKTIGSRNNENSIAKNLYHVLRAFDEEDVEYIYSESFGQEGIGNAIMNRLDKAAGHHVIQASEITRLQKYRRILFVSKGDTCRGPMAAELLRHESLTKEYKIGSRGMVVLFPEPANQKAEAIMRSQKMTIASHEAVQFTEDDLDEDTLVLTFEAAQKWKIVSDYENVKNVYTLGEFVGDEREVEIAVGQPLPVYGEKFELLKELIHKLANKLNEEGKKI
jgi:L-threonylcarbamoyladenylate synthase